MTKDSFAASFEVPLYSPNCAVPLATALSKKAA
jgi:hypothetical protein